MIELLSPAGSPEAVIAAVSNGADAIYIGFGTVNARRNAKNFTEDEFEATVRYCRVRGSKVYVTMNTLVGDREFGEATRLAKLSSDLGADALIVQDVGLARVLRTILPDMPLHASTQMSIHNLAGVEAAEELGFSRIVLARELSLDAISFINSRTSIETEVFAHGALCFCHSGQCYLSSLIGRRSGNRGVCAQPCRLQYSMGGRKDDYPMSLKDNCLVEHLEALESAGVSCLKIEGRMRRPEYTAIVTDIYSRAIKNRKQPTAEEMEQLEQAFSRQGFTDGYLIGDIDSGMFGVREEQEREPTKLFADVKRSYSSTELRRVPVKFFALIKREEPARFAIEDADGNCITVDGPVPEASVTQELTEQALEEQLYKTGGTPYACSQVTASIDRGLYLPAAALNEMRRLLISRLTERRKLPPARHTAHMPHPPVDFSVAEKPETIFQFTSAEQMTQTMAEYRPGRVYVPIELLSENFGCVLPFIDNGALPVAVLPRVITDAEYAEVYSMLVRLRNAGVQEALIGNLGQIKLARKAGCFIRGDFGLNAFNAYSLEILAKAGFMSATMSFELRLKQIADMLKPLDTELIAYGRLPLMITDHCLMKNSAGRCVCSSDGQLSDRQGAVFPVLKSFGCRNTIYNSKKLFLADKRGDYEKINLHSIRLMFTTESARECETVAASYAGKSDYRPNGLTRGLYYRGVE